MQRRLELPSFPRRRESRASGARGIAAARRFPMPWIPAFAGMTKGLAAMTNVLVGTTKLVAGMILLLGVAHAAGTGKVFVSSEKDNTVAVIDGAKMELLASPLACKRPRHMQLSADRAALYIAYSDDHRIVQWNIATGKVTERYQVGEDPEIFDLSPDGRTLYASNEEDSELTAFDLGTRKKLFAVKVGGEPEGVKASADGKLVYVTSEVANMVHVIDVASRTVVKNIPVGKRPRRFLLTPTELWVTNELDGSASVIRIADHTVQGRIAFLPPGMRSEDVTPVGMALSPDGKTAYVALGRANHVAVVDVPSRQVKSYVLVGHRPWGLALNRDGSRLYVANGQSDDLTIVDTASGKSLRTVKVGRVPHSVVVDD
jgi:PQQ-dependent catabolism-associated beta-propeller protein